ncbi:MAG: DUF547 domain-containing protein [Verrucomicrobiota bacterium]
MLPTRQTQPLSLPARTIRYGTPGANGCPLVIDTKIVEKLIMMIHRTLWLIVAALCCTMFLLQLPIAAASVPETTPESKNERKNENTSVNHQLLDKLLKKHVHGKGVDYAGLREDIDLLNAYLEELADAQLENASRDEQLALYINAYNAFTLKLVVERYPQLDSIRDISNPWGTEQWNVAGKNLSLDQIEHAILRGKLKAPRSHFAISRASVSAPPLQPFAYDPEHIHEQLDSVTRNFINSDNVRFPENKNSKDNNKYKLKLSRIFKWFDSDFKPSVPEFIAQYVDPQTAEIIRRNRKKLILTFQDYDWGLNDYIK